MKNKNQQIISLLKKTNLELKKQLEESIYYGALILEPQQIIAELLEKLTESEKTLDMFMGLEIDCSFKLEEAEKELGYYRWYEDHIEQQRSDTFYDMRNGNEYRTRGGCRSQYEKEMELKEIEWNKQQSLKK